MHSLFPSRITSIRTVPRKVPSRIVAEFSRQRKDIQEDILTIQDEGKYTSEYLALVGNFLLLRL
jgi:tRNA1(Val) A37 N6-methylase TrmN6